MEEFPILVTKADALEYASRRLARMALDIKLAEIVTGATSVEQMPTLPTARNTIKSQQWRGIAS